MMATYLVTTAHCRCCNDAPGRYAMPRCELLIVGAGPYGLAIAAYAAQRGLAYHLVGDPMGFWKNHMPRGMLLRSGIDWQLDALHTYTLRAFLAEHSLDPAAI